MSACVYIFVFARSRVFFLGVCVCVRERLMEIHRNEE